MSEPRRYARIYHGIDDDPKFATVFNDDHLLATWVRLLLRADAAWPAAVPIPRRVAQDALDVLVAVGLVDLLPDDRYRIHGLDRVRREVADKAAIGGRARAEDAPRSAGRFLPANAGERTSERWNGHQRGTSDQPTQPTNQRDHQRSLVTCETCHGGAVYLEGAFRIIHEDGCPDMSGTSPGPDEARAVLDAIGERMGWRPSKERPA